MLMCVCTHTHTQMHTHARARTPTPTPMLVGARLVTDFIRRIIRQFKVSSDLSTHADVYVHTHKHTHTPHTHTTQTRLPYGFEYDGRDLDVASLTAPHTIPGLLAAVNALQVGCMEVAHTHTDTRTHAHTHLANAAVSAL